MKLRMGRVELLTGLQRVQGVVEKRNTMPILSNILIEAKQEGVEIVATDLEIGMRGLYKATVEKPGGITVSARKLYEIIKELAVGEIEITSGDNNWTTIHAGKSQFKIVGLPSTDYPALPTIEREGLIPLAGAGFLELIRKTLFAAGDNDARYILNGLLGDPHHIGEENDLAVGWHRWTSVGGCRAGGRKGRRQRRSTRDQSHHSEESGA